MLGQVGMRGYCPCKGWTKCFEYALRIIYEGGNEMLEQRILGIQKNARALYDLALIIGANGDGGCEEDSQDLYGVVDEIVNLDIPELLEEIQRLQKDADEWEKQYDDRCGIALEQEISRDD